MVDADEPVPEWIVADAAADVGDERQKSAQALRAAGGVLGDFLVGTVAVEGARRGGGAAEVGWDILYWHEMVASVERERGWSKVESGVQIDY